MLVSLGIRFHCEDEYRGKPPDRKAHELALFKNVELPLTPEDWCRICMNDGEEYMGGCCGSMSAVQDVVNKWFRFDSGWVSCDELSEVAQAFVDHGDGWWKDWGACQEQGLIEDGETLGDFIERIIANEADSAPPDRKPRWGNFSAWDKIHLVWFIVKGHYAPRVPKGYGDHMSEWDKAVSMLSRGCTAISWHRMFQEDESPQKRANYLLILARILPALRTVWTSIEEVAPEPFEGLALIDKEAGPDKVASNGRGLCVFSSRKEVDEILDLWRRQDAEQEEPRTKPVDERIGVRPVRISVQEGLVFTD
jgi:hypothetical protein